MPLTECQMQQIYSSYWRHWWHPFPTTISIISPNPTPSCTPALPRMNIREVWKWRPRLAAYFRCNIHSQNQDISLYTTFGFQPANVQAQPFNSSTSDSSIATCRPNAPSMFLKTLWSLLVAHRRSTEFIINIANRNKCWGDCSLVRNATVKDLRK